MNGFQLVNENNTILVRENRYSSLQKMPNMWGVSKVYIPKCNLREYGKVASY